ncbi:SDR family oxidoreductase [Ahrensia sp. R2A130]|uniref:SDR family oxidoreductase n=1 Tax=Ahrensia sp. R2A130 TaxID=744979 RepID=UPI0001E0F0F1|nr:SDR family NAD(P)-dependent oxidoreductase [Ahrensia sp. R2A130]EFL89019.1 rhamnolipids biosynthesis 3-oxoacyl-(acyl-carrier-protein) reductase [Ahrensia sp. R2A130]
MSIFEDLFSVAGKTALVTGGASGIGRMMAQALVEAGAHVIICSRKGDACEAVAAELNALDASGSAEGFAADLSSEEGVKAASNEVMSRCDKLHILCNNAGATWGSSYEEFPRAAWDKVMTLNVAAVFELTRDLTPLLEKTATDADPARIINTASVMGIKPIADGCWSYSTSKAAVIHLTEILANEMTDKRITVNALAPGPFPSKMTAFAIGSEEGAAKVGSLNPLGRVGRPADIAAATLFLCGHGGSYVTGTTIPLDGGYLVDTGDDGLFAEG